MALEVRFGTVRPVSFREFDESYKYTDLTVEAKIAGTVSVLDYDKERYKDDGEAAAAVRSNATDLMQKSLDAMPSGRSIVRSDKSAVADQFAVELSKMGITAKAEIRLFSVIPESEVKLRKMWEIETIAGKTIGRPYGIIPGEDEDREPGTFRVNYEPSDVHFGFSSDRKYYAPGDDVEVVLRGIPGDTSCFFFANAEGYKVKYVDSYTARITFVMPDHDVDVLVTMEKQGFGHDE